MRLSRFPLLALAVALLAVGAGAQAANPTSGKSAGGRSSETHLLAIGVCPPYRKDIPVDACRNGVSSIVDSLKPALGIADANVISLVDERSTGSNVLKTLDGLRQRLQGDDRLILYLVLHGDAFYQWAEHYASSWAVRQVNQEISKPDDDILVFWTKEEPTVPALAIAQRDWLPVSEFIAALDKIPAHIALILDSCSSSLMFRTIHGRAADSERIDYVLTSSGSQQASNFTIALSSPLFGQELADAMDLPTVRTFGEAVEHARMSTVLHALAKCSAIAVPASAYPTLFPTLPVPRTQTLDGKVAPPLWFCTQVPNVVDFSGDMTNRPIVGAPD